MIKEHDRVVLTTGLASQQLVAGDVGTVVHVHEKGQAFEVEFMALDGHTVTIVTLQSSQVRAVTKRDLTHARLVGI